MMTGDTQESLMNNTEIIAGNAISRDLREDFSGLLSVLKKEVQVYQELLDLMSREKLVLLKPSLEKIQESNTRKETLILKSKMLEEARAHSTRKLGEALGLDQAELTLSILIRHADRKTGQELRNYQTALRAIVKSIAELNAANRSLLDASLVSINGLIGFINQMMHAGPTYADTGEIRNVKGGGRFVCTEG